jgi:hypothetical protein
MPTPIPSTLQASNAENTAAVDAVTEKIVQTLNTAKKQYRIFESIAESPGQQTVVASRAC